MGQVLHGSATTTEAIRRAIQHSQESLRILARRHGINQKTVAKWKKRSSTADLPTGRALGVGRGWTRLSRSRWRNGWTKVLIFRETGWFAGAAPT